MGSVLSLEQKEAIANAHALLKLKSYPHDKNSFYATYLDLPESYKTYVRYQVRLIVEEQNLDITTVHRIKLGRIYKFPIKYAVGDKEHIKDNAFDMDIMRPVVEVVKEMLEEKGVDRKFIIIPSEEIVDSTLTVLFIVPSMESETPTVSQVVGREPALLQHPEECVEYIKKTVRKRIENRLAKANPSDITKVIYIQISKFITIPRYYTLLVDDTKTYQFNTKPAIGEIVKEMLAEKGVDRKFVVRTGETNTTVSFVCNMPTETTCTETTETTETATETATA